MRAKRQQSEDEFERRRALNHELAALISFAVHDPKKMPEYKPPGKKKRGTSEIDDARVRAFFIGLATRSG